MCGWPFGSKRDDVKRELDAHLELEEEDLRDEGFEPHEARSAARRDLGNVTQVQEAVYRMNRAAWLDVLLRELRLAGRALLRSPGFTAVAVLSLGLGIGSATAIFTVADQALFRLLPIPEPSRLKLLEWEGDFIGGATKGWKKSFSYPLFRELESARPDALFGIAARHTDTAAVDGGSGVDRASVELVSGDYFRVLGVDAALGRTLTAEDDEQRDGEPWAVLAYDYWRNRFGSDPSVVGATIRVNGYPLTILGVAQRDFKGFEALRPTDLFVPLQMKPVVKPTWDHRDRRDSIWLNVFARLAPNVSPGQAEAALSSPYAAVLRRDLEAHPRDADRSERYLRNRLRLKDASQGFGATRKFAATPLHILLAMVGVLLLITCVNVATLLVIRSAQREKELAVRTSLGASRLAVIRLVLAECLMLSVAGSALGLALARFGAEFLVRMLPADRLGLALDASPDWRILAFTAGLGALTALLFGLTPALHASRSATAPSLKAGAVSTSLGRAQTRLRRSLVVAQVALSLSLLAIAGLFGKSLNKLFEVDSGLAVERLLSLSVDPSQHRYEPAQTLEFALDLQRRLELSPGVMSVSASAAPVLRGFGGQNTIKVEGYERGEGEDMQTGSNHVLPGFFSTMGVPLLAGRDFTTLDRLGSPAVVIVNETFANRFCGSPAEAMGRRVGTFSHEAPLPFEIIGVVADHKGVDLKEDAWPRTYQPLLQAKRPSYMAFYLHAQGDPEGLASGALRAVREIDAELAVFDVKTVARQVAETHYIERLLARLSGAFAALAMLNAAVGLYGTAAFSVARRTREIGVRVAVGARRRDVVSLVLRESMRLVVVGVLIGAPLAFVFGRLIDAQLYGVSASDASVSLTAVLSLVGVCLLASFEPARRATAISPVSALRQD